MTTLKGKRGFLTLASALATTAIVGVAFAAGPDVPEGPYIDFCPTADQIEAHLEKYGFDYKPTVACGESGQEVTGPGDSEASESDDVVFSREKERLLAAKRGPDLDGDPSTIEVIYADGTESTIFIQTDNPKYWDSLTLDEIAEILYP